MKTKSESKLNEINNNSVSSLTNRAASVAAIDSSALTKSVNNLYNSNIMESERHSRIKSNYVINNNQYNSVIQQTFETSRLPPRNSAISSRVIDLKSREKETPQLCQSKSPTIQNSRNNVLTNKINNIYNEPIISSYADKIESPIKVDQKYEMSQQIKKKI